MKNAAKQPNATKLPKLGESSAPMPDSAIALNSVETTSQRTTLWINLLGNLD